MSVGLFDTATPLAPLRAQIDAAIAQVLDRGVYILGPQVSAFEAEFAAMCAAAHGVGVANGTDAITIALRAMGVRPGDDVVVPSLTFYASAEAVVPTGARPVFCDVDPDTYCVTADTVRAALTPRTTAVIAVHLFGNMAPVREIAALGVPVLEDAAQAAGAQHVDGRPGSLGSAATFSFYPSKNLGALGDAGMITTSDADIAQRARMLRFHGSRDKVDHELIGVNSRLDELQAAVLRVLLAHLDEWAHGRRRSGAHYEQLGLSELVTLPHPARGCMPAWHLYVVRSPRVAQLSAGLTAAGIGNRGYYRRPTHRQEAMREYAQGVQLPVTDAIARENLALPMSPVLSEQQAGEVVAAVRAALGG